MNRIIQISTVVVPDGSGSQCDVLIVALCEDGTVWVCKPGQPWKQQPPIVART